MHKPRIHTDYLGLRVPQTVRKRLFEVALKRHLSVSQLVRLIIEDKLNKEATMENDTTRV
jgi:hypothetical protein